MKSEKVIFEGAYKGHIIGYIILGLILSIPFGFIFFSLLQELKGNQAEMVAAYLFFLIVVFIFVARKLLRKKKIKITESGIIFGEIYREWNEIGRIKPMKSRSFGNKKYAIMCSYKGLLATGFKIPLDNPLSDVEFNKLAQRIEETVLPNNPHLKVKMVRTKQ